MDALKTTFKHAKITIVVCAKIKSQLFEQIKCKISVFTSVYVTQWFNLLNKQRFSNLDFDVTCS